MVANAANVSITGVNNICKGASITLHATPAGGVWSSTNIFATVSPTGLVYGANAGSAVIKYTVTNASSCSAFANYNVKVNANPNMPTISYASASINPQTGAGGGSNFCNNRTFTVLGSPGGGIWSSSNTSQLTVTNPGGVCQTVGLGAVTLTYTYTNSNGCSNSRSITGTVIGCAARGVRNSEELKVDSYELYPNPAKTFIHLNIETLMGVGKLLITDYLGRVMKEQPLSLGINTIDVGKFAKGMYFVNIITEQGRDVKKVLVE